jgi:cold shock CspA family protein
MLKRFMTWLLSRLQGAFSALTGRRGRAQSSGPYASDISEPDSSQSGGYLADRVGRLQNELRKDRESDRATSAIPVAERVPYDPQAVALASPAELTQDSTEPNPFAPPQSQPQDPLRAQSPSSPSFPSKPTLHQPDHPPETTAASGEVTGNDAVDNVVQANVAQATALGMVSELMGKSLQSTPAGIPQNLPMRSLKKVGEPQLPAIHDLLPALEADPEASLPHDSPQAAQADLTQAASEDNVTTLEGSAIPAETSSLSADTDLPLDPVILFSFEITENDVLDGNDALDSDVTDLSISAETLGETVREDASESSDEEVLQNESGIDASMTATDSAIATTLESLELTDLELITPTLNPLDPIDPNFLDPLEPMDQRLESIPALESDLSETALPLEVTSEINHTATTDTAAAVTAESSQLFNGASLLPYPWAVPLNASDQDAAAQALPILALDVDEDAIAPSIDPSTAEPISSPIEAPNADSPEAPGGGMPTKTGIVKLLFTLKKGNFHGYITPDDGTKDILFHQKYVNEDIFDDLERGTHVSVAIRHVEGKAYATHIALL